MDREAWWAPSSPSEFTKVWHCLEDWAYSHGQDCHCCTDKRLTASWTEAHFQHLPVFLRVHCRITVHFKLLVSLVTKNGTGQTQLALELVMESGSPITTHLLGGRVSLWDHRSWDKSSQSQHYWHLELINSHWGCSVRHRCLADP